MIAARMGLAPPAQRDGAPATGTPRDLAAARQISPAQSTTGTPWYAPATAYEVVGTRGRRRLVLLVEQCPYCRCSHLHSASVDFVSGKRTAACHEGRYTVLVGTRQGVSR